jgi:hypothetical protein
MWARMPDVMLSKCAEALALRKAFPQELSNLYTSDELGQADRDQDPPPVVNIAPEETGPQPEQEAPARPWSNYSGMVNEFAKLRGRLGHHDHIYGEVLREFAVEHSNQFPDYATATAAYRKLRSRVLEIEAANQPDAEVATDDYEAAT